MLHQKLEAKAYLIATLIILTGGFIEFSSASTSIYSSIEETVLFFLGICFRNLLIIVLPSFCTRILLDRMGFIVSYKKAVAIMCVSIFLPLVITPTFKLLFNPQLNSEFGFLLNKAIKYTTIVFIVSGLIYFIQALRKEIKVIFRRALFVGIFILIMVFFLISPFYSGYEI